MSSAARHHAEWLSLVETSGPFLSMPVLLRVFPQGLDAHDPEHSKELRAAFEEWEESGGDPAYQRAWARYVLTETLGMPDEVLAEGQGLPPGLGATVAEHGETLRPDLAVLDPDSGKARLLVQVMPPGQDLEKPVEGLRWKAAPATRMMELLHASDVKLGLLTNGERWMLVYAPRGETTGFASWYASLWLEEAITLRAFRSLLSVERFFGVADEDTAEALLEESAKDQQEVTDQLGYQVRHAVEVLVRAVDRADKDRGRTLLSGTDEGGLYEAALTVMMRLVFLFSAEERELLLLGDPLYDEHYAVSTLRDQLREAADRHGEEVLERRHDAWSRLLSTFRAVHAGVEHDAMRLPAYGGTLFDPDRYPFLEGREPGTRWRESPARPLPIHNRTVLHLLEALQLLRVKVPGGGPAEARRLSFRALDIEQIGHVYEGLLDHTALRAPETMLGLTGGKDKEPEAALSALEELREKGEHALLEYLKKETGRTVSALKKALSGAELLDEGRWRAAFDNDEELAERARPFAGLVRQDTSGYPVVILAESAYVTKGSDRRESGTHYTPRSLTEPIVQHTLDPLVYEGPAEGWPKEEWRLRSAKEILGLTVCDMAMGSAAFLVQACRYLSERLVEAWEKAEAASGGRPVVSPEGDVLLADSGEEPLPRDPAERLALARRVVADRCLYGVDKNPLAVEMGKLSLWLTTLQKGVPFTFLDHALRSGDSLLGITNPDQLTHWSLDPRISRDRPWLAVSAEKALHMALDLRRRLHAFPVLSVRDAEAKAQLLAQTEEAMELVRLGADLLVAASLRLPKRREAMSNALLSEFHSLALEYENLREGGLTGEASGGFAELRVKADELLGGRRPFHWPLEFPEAFVETEEPSIIDGRLPLDAGDLLAELSKPKEAFVSGFAAIVGNPPFQGGQKITGALGTDYRNYLVEHVASGKRGSADLSAYFLLRACVLLQNGGGMGLLATNTIAQGDTREVGLGQLTGNGCVIIRAVPSSKWPGGANLEVAHLWLRRKDWAGLYLLDGQTVSGITSYLAESGAAQGEPYRLATNANRSFQGSIVLGMGFVLKPEETRALIESDQDNRDVLFPYLSGDDLNSRPGQSPSRWVINFRNWPKERAEAYADSWAIIEERVKPERQRKKGTGEYALRKPLPQRYWQYGEKRPALYSAIAELQRVWVGVLHTKHWAVSACSPATVFSHALVVFALEGRADFSLLTSSVHETWARKRSGSLETRLRYSMTDCFETFPFPHGTFGLENIGERYHAHRQGIMQSRQEGLTKTYNRFHDPEESAEDIEQLRELHVELDEAVADAYGWGDLDLGHGFHETKQGLRFTISEEARREILDRLLLLNHERYAEEVKQGFHDKKAKRRPAKRRAKAPTKEGGALPLTDFGDGAQPSP